MTMMESQIQNWHFLSWTSGQGDYKTVLLFVVAATFQEGQTVDMLLSNDGYMARIQPEHCWVSFLFEFYYPDFVFLLCLMRNSFPIILASAILKMPSYTCFLS